MKNNVFLLVSFVYGLTIGFTSFGMEELSHFLGPDGSLQKKILLEAAHQDPVNTIPSCALVCKSWAQDMQLPEIQILKKIVINFNVKLCQQLILQKSSNDQKIEANENAIIEKFKNPLFCPFLYLNKGTNFPCYFINVLNALGYIEGEITVIRLLNGGFIVKC